MPDTNIFNFSLQIDGNLSFLNSYVQQALENGAQPYIPESERSGMLNISNFSSHDQLEASMHGLRFEAYELPKPPVPSRIPPPLLAPSAELVPVSEPSYSRETHQVATMPSVSDAGSLELKLRLDGVQRKWGKPTYSSPASSTSTSTTQNTVNGVTQVDGAGNVNSKARNTYDPRRPQVEISPEKQKLAASLFGGTSQTEKRPTSASHKVAKASSHAAEKSQAPKAVVVSNEVTVEKTNHQPPPDLLDLGEPTVTTSSAPSVDPFKQLEGLLDPTQVTSTVNHGAVGATETPDVISLYANTPASVQSSSAEISLPNNKDDINVTSTLATQFTTKGPNHKDAIEKDALVRQMGVTPSSQNPNLFRDLLG
jgi:AP-4 complex subunit epsilon-1